MPNTPTMRFRNFGGIHQFMVGDEGDLARIDSLDPARWAATSAPLRDLHCDPAFLAALDPDGTGRIRVSQLIAGRDWLFERLANRARLRERSDTLVLGDLDASREPGQKLQAAANDVIKELKLKDASRLSLAEVRAFRSGYQKTLANGDGVVPPEAVADADVAQLVKDIIATTGGAKDAGGSDGVGQVELDRFLTGAGAWLEWRAKGATAQPWGPATEAAAGLVASLDAKLEEFFLQCELLRQEQKTPESVVLKDDDVRALRLKDAASLQKFLADSPIATPLASGVLSLMAPPSAMALGGAPIASGAINAVYSDQLEELRAKVLVKALGPSVHELSRASWRQVKALFDGWNGWQKDKPKESYDALGEDRVKAMLDGALAARLVALIDKDKAAAPHIAQVGDLEKVILLQRWLIQLANNFVNFSAIYKPSETALIDMGSLVIDGRRLDFCLKVTDRGGHKKVAAESLVYLIYAQITAKDGAAPAYEIVAPVTGGERGRLRVGKRGIFIDLDKKEWDAEVVEILENPISVKEAMFAPFRRVSQFVSKKMEEWISKAQEEQEKAMRSHAEAGVTATQATTEQALKDVADGKTPPVEKAPPPPPPPPPKPEGKGLDINSLILGGGIALGGVAAVFGAVFGLLATIKGWLAIMGVIAAVLALSGLVGWLKLRRRDMSLILEASGWALNISMNINRRISRVFTFTPDLPQGAVKDRFDLLATDEDKGSGGTIVLLVLLLLAGALAYWWFWTDHSFPRSLFPTQ